jgi:hypothetical protein
VSSEKPEIVVVVTDSADIYRALSLTRRAELSIFTSVLYLVGKMHKKPNWDNEAR